MGTIIAHGCSGIGRTIAGQRSRMPGHHELWRQAGENIETPQRIFRFESNRSVSQNWRSEKPLEKENGSGEPFSSE